MDREIKFRAWDKVWNMLYLNGLVMYGEGWATGNPDLKFYELHFGEHGLAKVQASETPIMQYTGLKDCKGKEIYEGDIVKVYGELRKVEFKNAFWFLENIEMEGVLGGFGTQTEAGHKPLYRYSEKNIEMVGNIYEHPKKFKTHI